jgi:hypothetical protein
MVRKPMQHFEACNEVSYIQSINPLHPGKTFNNDPVCFQEYRNMQSRFAALDGFDKQAAQMLMDGGWALENDDMKREYEKEENAQFPLGLGGPLASE